jgi:hypothetical protein
MPYRSGRTKSWIKVNPKPGHAAHTGRDPVGMLDQETAKLDGGGRALCAPDARLPNSSEIVVAPSELSNMRLLSILSRALPALPLLVATAERLWWPSPPCTLALA